MRGKQSEGWKQQIVFVRFLTVTLLVTFETLTVVSEERIVSPQQLFASMVVRQQLCRKCDLIVVAEAAGDSNGHLANGFLSRPRRKPEK